MVGQPGKTRRSDIENIDRRGTTRQGPLMIEDLRPLPHQSQRNTRLEELRVVAFFIRVPNGRGKKTTYSFSGSVGVSR